MASVDDSGCTRATLGKSPIFHDMKLKPSSVRSCLVFLGSETGEGASVQRAGIYDFFRKCLCSARDRKCEDAPEPIA